VGTGFSSENASLDELDYFPSRWAIPSGAKMDRARFPSLRMAFGTTPNCAGSIRTCNLFTQF
jgi:hypothetical protein